MVNIEIFALMLAGRREVKPDYRVNNMPELHRRIGGMGSRERGELFETIETRANAIILARKKRGYRR